LTQVFDSGKFLRFARLDFRYVGEVGQANGPILHAAERAWWSWESSKESSSWRGGRIF
jgi:hypothetical protein